jgi:hypothetical protein
MTDPDLFSDDELVSAYLDGEATPDERARVENDPRLQRRLGELRAVSRAVGTPHFFPESPRRDEIIARAVAATAPAAAPGGLVVDLVAARRRRRVVVALSAAAAVLLVLIAAPLALREDRGDQQTAIEAGQDATDDAGEIAEDADTDGAVAENDDDQAPAAADGGE